MLEQSDLPGTVPLLDGFYCGTAALYPVRILPLVEKILVGKDRSFQRLIDEALKGGLMNAKEIPASRAALSNNCNSLRICSGGVLAVGVQRCQEVAVSQASNHLDLYRAGLIRWLTRIRIEGGKRQPVCFAIVHRNEKLSRPDCRRHKCQRSNLGTP